MLSSDGLKDEGDFPNGAAFGPRKAKLKNALLLSPLWQGDGCVGLSGLYAVVNAIRLALAHKRVLNSVEVHELLAAGMQFMAGRLTPRQVVLSGLRVTLWRGLVEAMAEATRRRLGERVSVERLYTPECGREAAFTTIEKAITMMRVPMMLCRGGRYTVVRGFTRSSLLLFDSAGSCWVTKRICGVPGDCDRLRHLIYPASFLALNV